MVEPRICRCGRTFFPTHGNQKLCNPACRRKRSLAPRFIASEPRVCACCRSSFRPRSENQRFCSAGCMYAVRVPLERRLYRGQAKRRRAAAPLVSTGMVRCARGAACKFAVNGVGGLILPGQRWDWGHADGESAGGPEHSECNRGAPSRLRLNDSRERWSREW